MKTRFGIALAALVFLSSCVAQRRVVYLPDTDRITAEELASNSEIFEARIIPKDILTIAVNTTTPEAGAPFNIGSSAGSSLPTSYQQQISNNTLQTYIVDNQGEINFPVLGRIKVVGLTRIELQDQIKEKIYPRYISEEPIVNVRFKNYKVSVLGEVGRPGTFTVENEQCTLFDALALAGDMTIYGDRGNVLLIREDATGAKTLKRIDLQSNSIITDPDIYYLLQNDVLYVSPNRTKARQAGLGTAESFSISVVGILVSVATLIITVVR